MTKVVYAIRHKETQEFMPMMRRNKGYSHWNPGNKKDKPSCVVDNTIRILKTEKQAKACVSQWFNNPNAEYRGYTSAFGEDDYDVQITNDGRKKEDLEIVMFELRELGVV